MNIEFMLKNFNIEKEKGATKEEITIAEKIYNFVLPNFYKEMLIFSNGMDIDSIVGEENFISLFGLKRIYEDNRDLYETSIYLPGFLVIGCTGGEEVLVVEQKKQTKKIYIYDDDALFPNEETFVVVNIEKWFLNGCPMGEELYKCIY
ncbi:SMI1/KNR4 family protein [Megamonas hypermegale]|uniref:SMI1/KNR4 family protein n=1 Tax=Megamonas hypermegale TaxID=158847 RepID=UPI0032085963